MGIGAKELELYIVPMWLENSTFLDEDRELFGNVWGIISKDETLGDVFNSHKILDLIPIPTLEKLNRKTKKYLFKRIPIPSFFETPYGDGISGCYDTVYMREVAEKLKWDELNGRVLAITNVKLRAYKVFNLDSFEQLSGEMVSEKSVIVSAAYFRYDPFAITKEAKHELGHTFGLSGCSNEYCIMSHKKDFDERHVPYCPSCREKLVVDR